MFSQSIFRQFSLPLTLVIGLVLFIGNPVQSQSGFSDIFGQVGKNLPFIGNRGDGGKSGSSSGLSDMFGKIGQNIPFIGNRGGGEKSGSSSGISDIFGKFGQNIPLIGTCDRIVYRGVANCMSNYAPSAVSSKGTCCAHRKYRACINGLKDGHQFAIQTKNCPPHSVSMSAIHRVSDAVAGFRASSCPKNSCKKSSKKSG